MAQTLNVRTRLSIFVSSFFPAIISSFVDNTDILSLSALFLAAYLFKEKAIFILVPVHIVQYFINEINHRISLSTSKSLNDLIREFFGIRHSLFVNIFLLMANTLLTLSTFLLIKEVESFIRFPRIFLFGYIFIFLLTPLFFAKLKKIRKLFFLNSLFLLPLFAYVFTGKLNFFVLLQQTAHTPVSTDLKIFQILAVIAGLNFPFWTHFFIGGYVSANNISIHRLQYNKLEQRFTQLFSFIFQMIIVLSFASFISLQKNGQLSASLIRFVYLVLPINLHFMPTIFFILSGLLGVIFISLSTSFAIGNFIGFDALPDQEITKSGWIRYFYFFQVVISFIVAQLLYSDATPFVIIAGIVNFALLLVVMYYLYIFGNMKDLMGRFKNTKFTNALLITTGMLIILTLLVISFGHILSL